MIKNTHPDFEYLLRHGEVNSNPELLDLLENLGIGYRQEAGRIQLETEPDLLDPGYLLEYMQSNISHGAADDILLEVYRSVHSTNDVVMQQLAGPGSSIRVCLAEKQSAGKGRRGRTWVSPFGRNIYLTLGRFFKGPVTSMGGLSLVAGMQVVETLRHFGIAEAGLKWPNDVLLDGGKLAGVLVELRPGDQRGVGVALGVGVNLAMNPDDAALIDQAWSSADRKVDVPRQKIVAHLASALIEAMHAFDVGGFTPFAARWDEYNLFAGQTIRIIRGDEEFIGVDQGVDENGNLLLGTASGVQVHNSGEVSMRPVSNP